MKHHTVSFDYKWIIVFISGLMVFTVLGFCSSASGIYITAVTNALGISRSLYSFTYSTRYITTAIVNVFFGTLISRFGAKKLIITGFASLITSSIIYSFTESIVVLCIGSVFLGIGLSFTTTTMVGAVVNKWCVSGHGTIMGVILAANGVGAAVARIILTPIINSSDPFGYRNAYRLVAFILALVAVVMMIFFKECPNDSGEKRFVRETNDKKIVNDKTVFRGPRFYIAILCIFLTGLVLQSVSNLADPHFKDRYVDIDMITAIMSLNSIMLSVSKFTTGFIYDKVGVRICTSICYVSAVLSMISLIFVTDSIMGTVWGFCYGILSSAALPLETVMLPIFARELFGKDTFDKVLGIFVSVNTAGYALGGPIASFIFDITRSYDLWIYISIGIITLIFVAMNAIVFASKKECTYNMCK